MRILNMCKSFGLRCLVVDVYEVSFSATESSTTITISSYTDVAFTS